MKLPSLSALAPPFTGLILLNCALAIAALAPEAAHAQTAGKTTTLHSFTGTGQFGVTRGLIKATDGNFYGITPDGGIDDGGLVFKVTPAGTYSVVHTQDDDDDTHLDGTSPVAIIQAKDGNLYGVCEAGGKEDDTEGGGGTFFEITLPGNSYTKLFDFDSSTSGVTPCAIVQGSDGNFYGLTTEGGSTDDGTYFRLSSSAGKWTRTTLYNFDFDGKVGSAPVAQLLVASDGNFYGVTNSGNGGGSTDANGAIFKGTIGGSVSLVHLMTNDESDDTANNIYPLMQASDGNLYGVSSSGSDNNNGYIYQCSTSGTFKIIYDFPSAVSDGDTPLCTLVQAADGNFYGSVNQGFGNDSSDPGSGPGGFFKLTPAGTYSVIEKLAKSDTGPQGPYGNLTESTPGVFFGVTGGGTGMDGTAIELVVSPTITSATAATATINKSFSYQITTHQTVTSYAATGLPTGLSISSSTGLISGTPTKSGTFSVALSATNCAGTGTAALSLTVNGPGTLGFGASSYSVNEYAGSITVHVLRSGGTEGAASVVCGTTSGTAKSGTDYTGKSATLTWADGDAAEQAFTVTIKDLGLDDGSSRSFSLKLSSPTGAALGSPTTATITIKENDPKEGELRFVSSAYSVDETAGTVTVHLERTVGTTGAVSVTCATTSGTAKSGTDYTGKSSTITWADGDKSEKSFVVTIMNRGSSGGGGLTFSVVLSAPTGSAILGTPATAAVTIE